MLNLNNKISQISGLKMVTTIPIEQEYYYIINERYKGKMPSFFNEEQIPESTFIKNKYGVIKSEIETYFSGDIEHELRHGLIPHASYDGGGWNSIGLYVFGFKRIKNCKKFPEITKIIESIPGMTSAQISLLKPGAYLKPHIDDTSAIVRIHLGIKIPGELPELGLRMSGKEVTWKDGELLILSSIRPHCAWNNTSENRIVFIVDVIHSQYLNRRLHICGNVLAQLAMKVIASRVTFLKKIPKSLIMIIHKTLGFGAYIILSLKKGMEI